MVVLLYNIRSLHNVGSIFRTSDAVGAEKIYLCGITPAPVDRFGKPRGPLVKVSLGAEKYLGWDASARTLPLTLKLIEKLKRAGYKIFAVEQDKRAVPYYKLKIVRPRRAPEAHPPWAEIRPWGKNCKLKIALVLGHERRGLPPSILQRADKILEIPMRGKTIEQTGHPRRTGRGKESLNVSVAAGIVMFYFAMSDRKPFCH